VDLNRLVEVVFRELAPLRQGRQVQLTHDVLPRLKLDHQGLHMVFTNLLSNAIKFTGPRPEAHIHIGVQIQAEHLQLSVRDNGVGFDPRQQQRLFRVFERLHSAQEFGGQGLGLALVRRIVERWQGVVWAESTPEDGAVFWMQLPQALAAGQDGLAGPPAATPPVPGE
jgi:signal transduction histidine kinase